MSRVTVVGAGFAGLTAAYELAKQGFDVRVIERQEQTGGLIHTHRTAYGLVETAANALLCNQDVETLFDELGLKFAEPKSERKKRYIYWDKPRRWPLDVGTSARLAVNALKISMGNEDLIPAAGESIAEWGRRFAGDDFARKLLAPALQGIYAGDPERMSAFLILKTLFADKPPKGTRKGSVAPEGGMGALIKALTQAIETKGGRIKLESDFTYSEDGSPIVIATSAWAAADILKNLHPNLSARLATCESLPLVTATCFFERNKEDLQGFGCLFPVEQRFHALGVLFNGSIFEGRTKARSETWILGGARYPDITAHDDQRILDAIAKDRERLGARRDAEPIDFKITRWNRAIPHYTLDWEKTLMTINPEPPLFLHGNYLGEIGLARIYARSQRLSRQLKELYG